MQGLLDVRLWERLGAGKNYQKLEQHPWFEQHSLQWTFQSSSSTAKHHAKLSSHLESHSHSRFIPCQQEINYDLCNKFVQEAIDYKEEHDPHNNHSKNCRRNWSRWSRKSWTMDKRRGRRD